MDTKEKNKVLLVEDELHKVLDCRCKCRFGCLYDLSFHVICHSLFVVRVVAVTPLNERVFVWLRIRASVVPGKSSFALKLGFKLLNCSEKRS